MVIISACFSGVFVPALAGANRMVLTAARPDRTSFGCGEADKYPYFDECFLRVAAEGPRLRRARDRTVQACVAAREIKEGMKPPSEPQLFIGAGAEAAAAALSLAGAAATEPTARQFAPLAGTRSAP